MPADGIRLRHAAALVKEVRATLNAKKAGPCESCGLRRHEDWDESQLHTQLGSIYDKLNKIARKLDEIKEQEEASEA